MATRLTYARVPRLFTDLDLADGEDRIASPPASAAI
jgi:hypothetical protein